MLDQKVLEKIIKDRLEQTLKCRFKQALFGGKDYTAVRISTFSKELAEEICEKQEIARRAEELVK